MLRVVRSSVVVAFAASACTNGAFDVPSFRGQANSDYAGWERFQTAIGSNMPTEPGTTNTDARVVQTVAPDFSTPPGLLLTGVGNIYSGFQLLNLFITDAAAAPITDIVLQVRTLGSELSYDSVAIEFFDTTGASQTVPALARQELFRESGAPLFPGFPSEIVETKWTWDTTVFPADFTAYRIVLPHATAHISVDRIELDTRTVPAPAGMLLVTLALARGSNRRRDAR